MDADNQSKPSDERSAFRIGIHLGDIIVKFGMIRIDLKPEAAALRRYLYDRHAGTSGPSAEPGRGV